VWCGRGEGVKHKHLLPYHRELLKYQGTQSLMERLPNCVCNDAIRQCGKHHGTRTHARTHARTARTHCTHARTHCTHTEHRWMDFRGITCMLRLIGCPFATRLMESNEDVFWIRALRFENVRICMMPTSWKDLFFKSLLCRCKILPCQFWEP